jgi:tetratricopeptide (TPR) repeat protein
MEDELERMVQEGDEKLAVLRKEYESLKEYSGLKEKEADASRNAEDASTLVDLGEDANMEGDFELAQTFFDQALEVYNSMGAMADFGELSKLHDLLGCNYRDQNRADKAISSFKTALQYSEMQNENKSTFTHATLLHNLGCTYADNNQHQVAFALFSSAASIFCELYTGRTEGGLSFPTDTPQKTVEEYRAEDQYRLAHANCLMNCADSTRVLAQEDSLPLLTDNSSDGDGCSCINTSSEPGESTLTDIGPAETQLQEYRDGKFNGYDKDGAASCMVAVTTDESTEQQGQEAVHTFIEAERFYREAFETYQTVVLRSVRYG